MMQAQSEPTAFGNQAQSELGRRLKKAARLQQSGQHGHAERICREILAASPRHGEANYRLGVVLSQQGRAAEGLPHLAAALKADPSQPQIWLSLVTALLGSGRLAQARALLEQFNAARFDDEATGATKAQLAERLYAQGMQCHRAEQYPDAELLYDTVLLVAPGHLGAIHMAGIVAYHTARFDDAANLLTIAIAGDDQNAEYFADLGKVYIAQRRHAEALACFERAVELNPSDAQSHSNRGTALHDLGRSDEALQAQQTALQLDAHYAHARLITCKILHDTGKLDAAADGYREMLATRPNEPVLHNNLGNILKDMGLAEAALAAYADAIRLDPNLVAAYSNRLLIGLYAADIPAEELTAEARRFGERFAAPLLRQRRFGNVADRERRIRIGFVSPDFITHPVCAFFEPFLEHLDRDAFETFAYSNALKHDACTIRLQSLFSVWRDIRTMGDDKAADLIEEDQIDILVDLSGHTKGHRLLIFARKPAPVQVTWLGYPGSTGIAAIDYHLVGMSVPPGAEHFSVEQVWRLPHMGSTFRPLLERIEPAERAPFETNGHVTFGYINNFAKVTDRALALWGRILHRVPGSRLLLIGEASANERFRSELDQRLVRNGIPLERVILQPRVREGYYALYNLIDIALDPFPFNGHTTSMDTLWMGVPFVAKRGFHQASRVGETILTSLGLPELIGDGDDGYVEAAASLALDPDRLRAIRHDLRGRTERSPLMDHASMGAHLGEAFRGMWRIWVDQQGAAATAEIAA